MFARQGKVVYFGVTVVFPGKSIPVLTGEIKSRERERERETERERDRQTDRERETERERKREREREREGKSERGVKSTLPAFFSL